MQPAVRENRLDFDRELDLAGPIEDAMPSLHPYRSILRLRETPRFPRSFLPKHCCWSMQKALLSKGDGWNSCRLPGGRPEPGF